MKTVRMSRRFVWWSQWSLAWLAVVSLALVVPVSCGIPIGENGRSSGSKEMSTTSDAWPESVRFVAHLDTPTFQGVLRDEDLAQLALSRPITTLAPAASLVDFHLGGPSGDQLIRLNVTIPANLLGIPFQYDVGVRYERHELDPPCDPDPTIRHVKVWHWNVECARRIQHGAGFEREKKYFNLHAYKHPTRPDCWRFWVKGEDGSSLCSDVDCMNKTEIVGKSLIFLSQWLFAKAVQKFKELTPHATPEQISEFLSFAVLAGIMTIGMEVVVITTARGVSTTTYIPAISTASGASSELQWLLALIPRYAAGGFVQKLSASIEEAVAAAEEPENHAPVANSGGPYTGYVNESIRLDGAGRDPDIGDSIIRYEWNFDPGISMEQSPRWTWGSPGTYSVRLRVQDRAGAWSDDAQTKVTINARPIVQPSPSPLPTPQTPVSPPPPATDAELVISFPTELRLRVGEGVWTPLRLTNRSGRSYQFTFGVEVSSGTWGFNVSPGYPPRSIAAYAKNEYRFFFGTEQPTGPGRYRLIGHVLDWNTDDTITKQSVTVIVQ